MNTEVNVRLIVTQAVLWFLLGAGAVSAGYRFLRGLGTATALNDLTPWGLWIGFDVVSGVALAAGGFVIAAVVHVFHLHRFHGIVRPAILTAFLGYAAVVVGLLADLGRPWNIWRMIVYWQPTSPLFEVGWCVMLYLSVLTLEFAPVVFEGLQWNRLYRLLRAFTLPLVVVGIALSTLHQSSLGSLFLINPERIHPLWYSPLLPLLFFVSAVGLGLATVVVEGVITSWLYRREAEWDVLPALLRAASIVLSLFLLLRLGDLAVRGSLRYLVEGSWWPMLFLLEVLLSVVVPVLLFTLPSFRSNRKALAAGAFLVVFGFVVNRATVAGISHVARTGFAYFPSLPELLVSLGIVALAALVFLFFVERLRVWEEPPQPAGHLRPAAHDPLSGLYVRAPWLGAPQRAAIACLAGGVLTAALLEAGVANGSQPRPNPVAPPRSVSALRIPRVAAPGNRLVLVLPSSDAEPQPQALQRATLIDGNRAGRWVLFEHEAHQQRLGGNLSCGRCHHFNLPLERGTSCGRCHRDMYRSTDTFSHDRHTAALGANGSCSRCHRSEGEKTRATATPCRECHEREVSRNAEIAVSPTTVAGVAPGYVKAMHGLCVTCHTKHEAAATPAREPYLSRCPACHREISDTGREMRVREGTVLLSSIAP
ncbi:MAG: Ni/Fe-hydrogenase cytochrome b subunit [Thermoanaerobaculaceae bacterium]|nr:Ni/Fe-hydrogenase cytochrome b subunit [Thermoanaerobaculaceae bacterium]